MKCIVLTVALLTAYCASAQGLAQPAAGEISRLFSALQGSSCAFYRNGSWYSAAQASDHLRSKYDYLVKKGMISTAENFIERAATKSSMSGEAYKVRCGNSPPVDSASWFGARLRDMRAASVAPHPQPAAH